jgi:hypothetical protein
MRRALVILAALIVVVTAVVALAPAAIVSVAIERIPGDAVALAETQGTVWRGRGTLAVRRTLRVPLAWRLEALPLARGEARITITPPAGAAAPRAEISARRDVVALRGLEVSVPAETIAALVLRAGVRLEGELEVTAPSLEWTRTAFAGGAVVRWRDARFAIANEPAMALGNVSADLAAAGDRLAGPVTNEGGDFDVRGTVSLGAARGAPDVALTLTPRDGSAAQARSLRLSALADGSGWNVEYRAVPR